MKTTKLLAFLSAAAMLGSVTACGKAEDSAPVQTTAAATAAETTVTTAAETTTVTTTTKPDPVFVDELKDKEIPVGAITFDTPSLYTAHAMGGGGDEAPVELSLVDFDGDKKLRVRVLRQDGEDFQVPKIVFNLGELIGAENTGKIGHISVDFTTLAREEWQNDDGTASVVVGNFLGALAGNIAKEKGKDADGNLTQNDWATHKEFSYQDWDNFGHTWRCEADIPALMVASNGYAENNDAATLVIMRWGQKNAVDFYIDNISILDKEGKAIPFIYNAVQNPAEVVKDGKDSAGKLDSSVIVSGTAAAATTAAATAAAVGSTTAAAGTTAAASTTAAESTTAAASTTAAETTAAAETTTAKAE
ncbi:MAG: hypothetical protein IK130_05565 [Oscillospiraceae bacterium]|nr:hypothetical protein [Oscillospiraceae bacterium]